jgi:hypothetical protein
MHGETLKTAPADHREVVFVFERELTGSMQSATRQLLRAARPLLYRPRTIVAPLSFHCMSTLRGQLVAFDMGRMAKKGGGA